MKKIILFSIILAVFGGCKKASETTPALPEFISIPNKAFEQTLINLGWDSDNTINAKIKTQDALKVYSLKVDWPTVGTITNFAGIEGFTNLSYFDCHSQTGLTKLDVSKNINLNFFDFSDTEVTTIDVTNCPNIQTLRCSSNLETIDLSKNSKINTLLVDDIKAPTFDLSKLPLLTTLSITNCKNLTSVDLSKVPLLTSLTLVYCNFPTIDLSKVPLLTYLNASGLNLISLDLSKVPKLTFLQIAQNKLTTIDISIVPILNYFRCDDNRIVVLDLTKNSAITTLSFYSFYIKKVCVNDVAKARDASA